MDTPPREYAETDSPPADGIIGGLANAFNSVRRVFADLFRLFSLEVRRAGLAFVWMVALGAMAAMLVVTAWLGLMGALALWAVSLGLSMITALAVLAMLNLVAAVLVILFCANISRNLLFPATQRQLETPPPPTDTP